MNITHFKRYDDYGDKTLYSVHWKIGVKHYIFHPYSDMIFPVIPADLSTSNYNITLSKGIQLFKL